ncbi:MAG: DNA translocase FtsK [candidate division KSB1 bacterium]|nr:DNA translocase FtsK [candidate division KSB1 bacterium]
MKVLRFFALLLVFTVFCAEQEPGRTPAVEKKQQKAREEQKIIKQPVQDSVALQAKIEELEQRKQTLEQRAKKLDAQQQKLAARQDSLNAQQQKLAEREQEIKQLHRNSWWTLIIGILLILIALVLFIIRPRPKSGKTQPAPSPKEPEQAKPDTQEVTKTEQADPLYDKAVESVLKEQSASVTRLQKALGVGRTRVNHLLEAMEEKGLVGPSRPNRTREVLSTWEEYTKS